MKRYKIAEQSYIPQQTTTRDRFVKRSREQALNVGVSRFLVVAMLLSSIQVLLFSFTGVVVIHLWLPIAVIYGLYRYANALFEFTNEDRDILFSQYQYQDTVERNQILTQNESETKETTTVIPQPKKGHFYLHVGLTETQLKHIAETMLNTNTLTVNYLESLGLSRQNSEKLRAELAEHNILSFSDNGRTRLTKPGERVCEKILK